MSHAIWYATIDGVEQGPHTVSELKELAARGRIVPDTPIRREGMDQCVPASRVKGLLAATTAPTESLASPAAPRIGAGGPATSVAGEASKPLWAPSPASPGPRAPATPRRGVASDPDNPFARPQSDLAAAIDEPLSGEPAGFWIRTAAYLIDIVPIVLLGILLIVVFGEEAFPEGRFANNVFGLGVTFIYFSLTEGIFATTLGKLLLGLRVVDSSGHRVGFPRALARNGSRAVLGLIPLIGLIDVAMVARETKRAWHDGMSGTVVIRRAKRSADERADVTSRRRPRK